MTEVQKALARADAAIARGKRRYEDLMVAYRRTNELPDDRLHRLAKVLRQLTPDELDAALGYAEGLAAWGSPAQESGDATLSTEGTETTARTG